VEIISIIVCKAWVAYIHLINNPFMKAYCLFLIAVFSATTAFSQSVTLPSDNPFSTKSSLQYQAPAFDKIKNEHYKAALEAGIQQKLEEIKAIAENKAQPTFQNTLVALEKSGRLFDRVSRVFSMVTGANNNDTLQKVQEEIAPKIAALNNAIFLDDALFSKVKSIYNQRQQLKLDAESLRLVEKYYKDFLQAGASLNSEEKAIIRKLNEESASLSAKFNKLLLAASKNAALVIDDVSQLKGLSENDIKSAKASAESKGMKGKWLLSITNTTMQPLMGSLQDRATRQKMFEASWARAEKNDSKDTRAIVKRIAVIRAQKAKLFGFANYATWSLQENMAKNPATVNQLFSKLFSVSVGKATIEAKEIQDLIDKQQRGFKLAAWDWDFYAEQIRKEKYSLDEGEVKQYFDLYKVLENGVFHAANLMYGLTFKERKDLPVYHPDVKVYEVFDNGKSFALFYADYFKRDNKRGGAWMSAAVGQSGLLGTNPVIYNVCNFPKPLSGQPALISFDNVTTMFHEFGHGLHGLFASQHYPTLSGTAVARDFVEFPSQFNEHWALEPKVLMNYAKHHATGQPISNELVAKIKKAAGFNKGYGQTHALASASLDMQWHSLSADEANAISDVDAFEQQALTKVGMNISYIPPRYRSSYFQHIWGSGYAAGYYAYTWTKMLEEDAYVWVKQHGGMTRANGERFRKLILSRGNTLDLDFMFRSFTGHAPNIESMIDELELNK
jgi:peptidyl-dipeptidase Dcp